MNNEIKCEYIEKGDTEKCGSKADIRINKNTNEFICGYCLEIEYEKISCMKCDCEDAEFLEYILINKTEYCVCDKCKENLEEKGKILKNIFSSN